MGACMCVCGGQKWMLGIPQSLPHFVLRWSLSESRVPDLVGQADLQPQRPSSLYLPTVGL